MNSRPATILMQALHHEPGETSWTLCLPLKSGSAILLQCSLKDIEEIHCSVRAVLFDVASEQINQEGIEV